MSSVPVPSHRMNASDRREQIIGCATRLFEARSYNDVSTAVIAAEAGVGRPLIHHYFGTKRNLYLEVVRRLSYIPAIAVTNLGGGTLDERIDASIERWLAVASRHRNMWLTTIAIDSTGVDKELAQISRQADDIAVERMLDAIGLSGTTEAHHKLRTMFLAYGGMAKAASRLWLVDKALTKAELHTLLAETLKTIVNDVAPVGRGDAVSVT